MSATQDITAEISSKKIKVKRWLSNPQDDTTTFCCCNIPSKVAKCLELTGLITKCCAKEYSGNTCSSFLSNWQTCALVNQHQCLYITIVGYHKIKSQNSLRI